MAKRTERHVRRVKETLTTRAARPAHERALAATTPDGPRQARQTTPAIQKPTSALGGIPSGMGGSTTPDDTGHIGTPGNLNVFGFLTGEDYNPDLDGFAMFPNYNKMRLSDAQVAATLLLMKLPMKAADWVVQPASEDAQDLAIADFVQANLIDDDALARSWQHVLDNAMLKFDFGCSAEEITWGLGEAGEAKILDLAPRLPRTFYRWAQDPKTGKLAYLQQFAPKNGQYGYWNIPAENLVLHVRSREGDSYYGRSTLRSAYPHWWWKQELYRIDIVGHDRFHVGIPRAALDEHYNATTAPLDKLEATLKGLRSHDRGYMIQPFGVTYDVYAPAQGGQGSTGIIQSIEHHNLMIARNMLQAFTAQGEQRHGSFGAAKVTSDVYFDALKGEANEIGSELKQGVVKRLCDLNFDMRGRKYPTIACTNISAVDFTQMATALAALAAAGLITAEDDLEAWLRDLCDAPGLPDALKGLPRGKAAPIAPPTPGTPTPTSPIQQPDEPAPPGTLEAARRSRFVEHGRAFGRMPTARERQILDLHGVPNALDQQQAALVREMAAIRRKQLTAVASRLTKKDTRKTSAFTDFRHVHITMPHTNEMVKAVRAAQTAALNYGRETVHAELTRQGATIPKSKALGTAAANRRSATSSLVSSAQITVRKNAENWKGRIMDAGLRIRRTGVQGAELEQRIISALEDEIDSGAKRDAAGEIHEAFGIGRANAAQDLSDLIESATYSAILDVNTCDPCHELDGEEFVVDSPAYEENLPPNANCDGQDSCRCVYLYIASDSGDDRIAATSARDVLELQHSIAILKASVETVAGSVAHLSAAGPSVVHVTTPPVTVSPSQVQVEHEQELRQSVETMQATVTALAATVSESARVAAIPPPPAPPRQTRKRLRVTKRDKQGRMVEGEVIETPES